MNYADSYTQTYTYIHTYTQIASTQAKLDQITPRYEAAVAEEQQAREALLDAERRVNELYAKQGRAQRFGSEKERNAWINKEVRAIEKTAAGLRREIDRLEKDLEETESLLGRDRSECERLRGSMAEIQDVIERSAEEYASLKAIRDEQTNRRKELWREDTGAWCVSVKRPSRRCDDAMMKLSTLLHRTWDSDAESQD